MVESTLITFISRHFSHGSFRDAVQLLQSNGGRAKRGDAMKCKLGDPGLSFYLVEGHIARSVYKQKAGDSVFRRITPIACILVWAGLCNHARGELRLR